MSLAARRDYLDLIMTYKLLHGILDIDVNKLNIVINSNNTRGGGTNIVVKSSSHSLCGKILHLQNSHTLEQSSISVKNSPSLTVFKRRLFYVLYLNYIIYNQLQLI